MKISPSSMAGNFCPPKHCASGITLVYSHPCRKICLECPLSSPETGVEGCTRHSLVAHRSWRPGGGGQRPEMSLCAQNRPLSAL